MARWFRATTAGTRTCYYEVLGVSRRDSLDTIKAAYFSLAKKHHPDTNPLHAQAASQTRFQEISEAYEFLSNPEKKQRYDAGISDGNFDPNGDPTLENLISIVRRHIVKQHQSTLFPTPAVEVVLTVTLDDLLHLGKDQHHITYQPFLQCDQCQGSGTLHSLCQNCLAGKLVCDCHEKCPACNGQGGLVSPKPKTVKVNIPFGISSGQVLIMKKLGHWTKRGGLGDLHVKVEIAPHLTFVRSSQNKFDLTALIAITLMESILGCSKPLWGTGMYVTIPPGSKHGQVVPQINLGLFKTPTRRGDLLCQVHVILPPNLTSKQISILQEFQNEEALKKS